MDIDQSAQRSGRCAAHPEQLATRHCDRCGNYMCDACDEAGAQRACPSCRARFDLTRFPIAREGFSLGAALEVAGATFKAHWGPLCAGAFVYLFVTVAFSVLGRLIEGSGVEPLAAALMVLIVNLLSMVVAWTIVMGLMRMSYDALEDRPPDLNTLFSQMSKVWKLIVATLVIGVALGVPMMLLFGGGAFLVTGTGADVIAFVMLALLAILMVPLVYVSLGLTFVANELVYDDRCGPIEAIRRSWAMADGHRLSIFGLWVVFFLVSLAGVLALCVGLIPAYAFMFLALTAAHRGLRNGMELPDPTRPVEF